MNNIISLYYNLSSLDVYTLDNNYLIFTKMNNYLFYEINKEINISQEYLSNKYYEIIYNKDNEISTKYDNKDYILLKIKGIFNNTLTIEDIIIQDKYNVSINNNWAILWGNKIDYLDNLIKNTKNNNIILCYSFLKGIGENAISYLSLNNINYQNIRVSVSHSRIPYKLYEYYYYNPLNTLLDYNIRDVAEYLKSKIYYNQDITNDLNIILDTYNIDEIKLIYARLLYPSIYYDLIEDSIKKDSNIPNYEELINNYIVLLKDSYLLFKKRTDLVVPYWLIKEN